MIGIFDKISGGKLFNNSLDYHRNNDSTEYTLRSDWFHAYSDLSLSAWVVAHFEARIFLIFRGSTEKLELLRSPLTHRETYMEIWEKMPEKLKEDSIKKTVDKIHRFSDFCLFESNSLEYQISEFKLKNLSSEEKVLRYIVEANDYKMKDRAQFKKSILDDIEKIKKNTDSKKFIRISISKNYSHCVRIENFFISLIFEILDQIYFEQYVIAEIMKDETTKPKKKKNKKKKTKNNEENETENNKMQKLFSAPPIVVEKTNNKTKKVEVNVENKVMENSFNIFEIFAHHKNEEIRGGFGDKKGVVLNKIEKHGNGEKTNEKPKEINNEKKNRKEVASKVGDKQTKKNLENGQSKPETLKQKEMSLVAETSLEKIEQFKLLIAENQNLRKAQKSTIDFKNPEFDCPLELKIPLLQEHYEEMKKLNNQSESIPFFENPNNQQSKNNEVKIEIGEIELNQNSPKKEFKMTKQDQNGIEIKSNENQLASTKSNQIENSKKDSEKSDVNIDLNFGIKKLDEITNEKTQQQKPNATELIQNQNKLTEMGFVFENKRSRKTGKKTKEIKKQPKIIELKNKKKEQQIRMKETTKDQTDISEKEEEEQEQNNNNRKTNKNDGKEILVKNQEEQAKNDKNTNINEFQELPVKNQKETEPKNNNKNFKDGNDTKLIKQNETEFKEKKIQKSKKNESNLNDLKMMHFNEQEIDTKIEPKIDEGIVYRKRHRKGSMSVDLNAIIRINEEKLAVIQVPKKSPNGANQSDGIRISDYVKPDSMDSEKDKQYSDNNEKPTQALETFSNQEYQFSVNDSKSVSVSGSQISYTDANNKNSNQKLKLRKIQRDGKTKKNDNYINNDSKYSNGMSIKSNYSYKESSDVYIPMRTSELKLKRDEQIIVKKIDQQKDDRNIETKKPTIQKKVQRPAEPKMVKIQYAKWDDSEVSLLTEPPKNQKNDFPKESNLNMAFEKKFSLKISRGISGEKNEHKFQHYSVQTHDEDKSKNVQTEPDEYKSGKNIDTKIREKRNVFKLQNKKNIVDYYPNYEQTSFFSIPKITMPNRFYPSDSKNRDQINFIQKTLISISKNYDSNFLEDEKLDKNSYAIKYTLKLITRKLDDDIQKLVKSLQVHNMSLEESRKMVLERLSDLVKRSLNPNIEIQAYGSFRTGLLTPFSDMDIAIINLEIYQLEKANEVLRLIRNNITCYDFVLKSSLFEQTAVPVLKFEADPSKSYENFTRSGLSSVVKVDLIVDISDGRNPVNTSFRTTEYICHAKASYSTFFENSLILKFATNCARLSSTYHGNLTRRNQFIRTLVALHRIFGNEFIGKVKNNWWHLSWFYQLFFKLFRSLKTRVKNDSHSIVT